MAYTAASDAFCSQTDVEGVVGRGALTSTTKPSAQFCLDWMAMVAAEVESVLFSNGVTYTVTAGGSPFPASPTDARTARLKKLAQAANIVGAAAQVLYAHDVKDEYGRVPAADALMKQYAGIIETIVAVAKAAGDYANFSDDQTDGLTFLSDTEF